MDIFNNIFPENLYHSYVIEGDPEATGIILNKFLIKRGEIKENSPDLLMQFYDSFTIDDSRKIKEWNNEKGITNDKKICILGVKFINHDAERTLLKMIEEPALNTHFFIIIPNSSALLDTLKSRVHIIKLTQVSSQKSSDKNDDFAIMAKEFVLMNPKDRIDFVSKIIKKYKDEESSSSLRFMAINFINEIEKIIFYKFKKNSKDENTLFILAELQKSREFLNLPGASVKMILENLALVI